MKHNKTLPKCMLAVGLLSSGSSAQAALTVTPGLSAADLTNLIVGAGVTVSGTPVFSGDSAGNGAFSGGLSAGLQIDTGIILSTGRVVDAVGPNSSDETSTDLAGSDITSLTFDFETAGGDLFFNYVFASEEYNEYVNSSFNDFFTFKLDGTNIALIPGTMTPVEINTVNLSSNSGFYVNNDIASGAPNNIEYDGFTTAFTATALGLTPGTHTIELLIADVGDENFDSAVFLQGGSFSDTETPPSMSAIPEPGSALSLAALLGLGLCSRRRVK